MPVIYHVHIQPTDKENVFQVTWINPERLQKECFLRESELTHREARFLWQKAGYQLSIGEKLFRFLDGDLRHLSNALNESEAQGDSLEIYLWACKEVSDWPFELLADSGTFLLPTKAHIIRCVSRFGEKKQIPPQDRHLKCLFMACSAKGVEPELNFEREEEGIYKATENFPIEISVEDSGSLEGLKRFLETERPDVVHLSGHADISPEGLPFFIMEDEFGQMQMVYPDDLWNEALIENSPRLLFLSGCRTGEAPDTEINTDGASFAHLLIEKYNVPTVLGWGRNVKDRQAIYAEKVLFHELSRGRSILDAVQRVRYELMNNFLTGKEDEKTMWPLLRLFSAGIPLNAIVTKGQKFKPSAQYFNRFIMRHGPLNVPIDGLVGIRRQLQHSFYTLKCDYDKIGVLILGTAGSGKSCLAGKICDRLSDHTYIVVKGKLDSFSLNEALREAFITSQDKEGAEILAQQSDMKDKLAALCARSFKDHRYLIVLDDFDQNIEGAEKGRPSVLYPEAAELLSILLRHLHLGGKMTQIVITSRYDFSLTRQGYDLVQERLGKVRLISLNETEQKKKLSSLIHLIAYQNGLCALALMREGYGNPRLMDILNELLARLGPVDEAELNRAVKEEREKFIRENCLHLLVENGGKELRDFLRIFGDFNGFLTIESVKDNALKAGLNNWEGLLKRGIQLSLIETDISEKMCQVNPILDSTLLN